MRAVELLDAFDVGLDEFGRRVHQVADGQWQDPTPCREWSVRDLVNHLVSEHLWAPLLLRGVTLAEVGDRFDGDVLGDDPVGAWEEAAEGSYQAFHRPGALQGRVHTSMGLLPAEEYARQMTTDLAVHSWDLARGIGVSDRLDEGLVDLVYDTVLPYADTLSDSGVFAPPVPVPPEAPRQDRLVALLGRQP